MPLPPLAEQDEIIAHVRAHVQKIDTVTAKVREQIDKLREYRQALITAAVTGKIDLR